ncbi:hypothetical protein CBS101457_001385 [Exobasidium rhododendri]|nr:hypothetical protein CBS101457_001385 [Exobasidium rhododendri]
MEPPEAAWPLLIDAHCHPTDDPRPWDNADVLKEKLSDLQIGKICAMSTCVRDQVLVSQLATQLPHKVIPAFGYHPWFVHLISDQKYVDTKDHYRHLFKDEKAADQLEALLPGLPEPITLSNILSNLRSNLEKHPNALLGEVGIDRAFRLPCNPKGWTRGPDDYANTHSLALRERPLTDLNTPMYHQIYVIKKQIAIAIELGRSISFHSVRAGGATISLFDDLKKEFPSKEQGLNKKQRRLLQNDQAKEGDEEDIAESTRMQNRCFEDINVDLHSCTLSPTMISQLQKKHRNLYVSFSIAINERQKDLHDQLLACDPTRLLIESDYHSAEELGVKCWQMVRLAADVLGDRLPTGQMSQEYRYVEAAKIFLSNWDRFHHSS